MSDYTPNALRREKATEHKIVMGLELWVNGENISYILACPANTSNAYASAFLRSHPRDEHERAIVALLELFHK